MTSKLSTRVLFLAWESPWPAQSGGELRTLGLLRELAKTFEIELIVISRDGLSIEQMDFLQSFAHSIIIVPMRTATIRDKLRILSKMMWHCLPFHCAILQVSFLQAQDILCKLLGHQGVVYASYGHWGTLVVNRNSFNWILDQHNADVDFWRVYASQASRIWLKIAALINWKLADRHFRQIYPGIGRIISVCEEDRQLTLTLAPRNFVDVIENGVDCAFFSPDRSVRDRTPRILFTGTSAERNMTALRQFVQNILPQVQQEVNDVELLVAGNFSAKAQAEFTGQAQMRFTGRVDDMRPFFNQSDVFVAPFSDTHGSKLKIAEAMAMAMPIVSTTMGIRGFQLIDGESVLIADSNRQFAKQVVRLLREPEQCRALGRAAREVALSTIDWSVLGKRLVALVQATLDTL